MLERVLIAILLVALGVVVWQLNNRLTLRRAARNAPKDPLLVDVTPGVPVVLYFTTPFCAPCETQQKPALAQLARQLPEQVQIIQIDATQDPVSADRWGVFSAPTTFVLDRTHTPRHVNRGVASTEQLLQQLNEAV